jgi:hypothetical protein
MKTVRKCLSVLLVAVFLCGALAFTADAAGLTATPTRQSVMVNNSLVSIQGYAIGGSNYFKLRDLAMIIKGNGKNFSVDWDAKTDAAWLTMGRSYGPVGGELAMAGSADSVTAEPTATNIYLNGEKIYITAYLIGSANYIKLRDLGAAMDFGVTFDGVKNSVVVNTAQEYYIPTILNALPDSFYVAGDKTIYYYGTDTGKMTVYIYGEKHFELSAYDISSAGDYDAFKLILGFFVSAPDTVLDTLKGLKPEGKKELTLDGKTVVCVYNGLTQIVDIEW